MTTHNAPPDDPRDAQGADDDLLGAWALGALDDDEEAAVERHLADDPDARLEADRLRGAVDDLVEALAVAPPADLWSRIEADLVPRSPEVGGHFIGTGPDSVATEVAEVTEPSDELAAARARRGAGRRRWAGAAAAVLVLVAGVGLGRSTSGGATDDVAQQLRAEATRLSQSSDTRTATLTGPGGSVRVVVGADGRAILEADLTSVPAERTYQLWSIDGPEPVSLGLLGPDPDVVLVGTGTATRLAVSTEPVQGSTAPTTTPVVTGQLT